MTLDLDKKQYENLIKLVSLGNWMANSHREEPLEDFENLLQTILTQAPAADLGALVEKDEETGLTFPSEDLETILGSFVEEYDQDYFWDELVEYLVERDLHEQFGDDEIESMSEQDFLENERKLAEKYLAEFEESGIDNLYLKK